MRNSLQGAAVALIVLGLSACAKPADPVPEAPVEDAAAVPSGADAGAAGAAQPQAAAVSSPSATYACDGNTVAATFDNSTGDGSVTLQVGANRLVLPHAVAASGSRYADQAGNEFWEHQGEATLTLAGGKQQKCVEAAAGN